MIFDVLAIDGECLLARTQEERRKGLEGLMLDASAWSTPASFDDGRSLYAAVCDRGLEGIVAKRQRSSYRPGRRGWTKVKNPDYWRRESELAILRSKKQRGLTPDGPYATTRPG